MKQTQEEKVKQLEDLYCSLFDTDIGKQVLRDLDDKFFMNKSVYSQSHSDMSCNEGNRQVVQYIRNRMNRLATNKMKQMREK